MGRPSYIATDLVENAVITMSNEDTAYPAENVADPDYAKVTRWTTDGSNWIEFDLQDSLACESLFWGNHNHPSSGFSMTVKGGSSPSPTTTLGTGVWTEKGFAVNWTQANYRYIRVEFSDTQPTGSVPQVGRVVIGVPQVLPRGVRFGEWPWYDQEGVNRRTNRGKRYRLELYRNEQFTYTFRFPWSEKVQFLNWWKAVGGMLYPFVWYPVDGDTEAYYVGIMDDGFKPKELPQQAAESVLDYRVELVEEGLGAEISL